MKHVIVCIVTMLGVVATQATAQQTGKIKFSVNPGRAGVFVDGKYLGPAANFRVGRTYAVSSGEHEIRLSEPRYQEVVKKVNVEPGKTTTIAEVMKALPVPKPPFGTLRTISTDKFAAVYVNGHFMGHTDEFSNSHQGLLLNPGDYDVKIVSPGSTSGYEEKVKIQANTIAVVRVK